MNKPTKTDKANALIGLRKHWNYHDYLEAYQDDFKYSNSPMPKIIPEWKSYMNELIHNSYTEELINQCLTDEIDLINNYK